MTDFIFLLTEDSLIEVDEIMIKGDTSKLSVLFIFSISRNWRKFDSKESTRREKRVDIPQNGNALPPPSLFFSRLSAQRYYRKKFPVRERSQFNPLSSQESMIRFFSSLRIKLSKTESILITSLQDGQGQDLRRRAVPLQRQLSGEGSLRVEDGGPACG